MKLDEIRKHVINLNGSKQEVSAFLKSLYNHSVQVIESIPNDEILSILNNAQGYVHGITLHKKRNSNTVVVNFEQYDGDCIDSFKYYETDDNFDFDGFQVSIILAETVKVNFSADFSDIKYKTFYNFNKDEAIKEFFGTDLHSNFSDGSYIDFTLNIEYFTKN